MPKIIGLVVNRTKPNAVQVTQQIVKAIGACSGQVFIEEEAAHALGMSEYALSTSDFHGKVDLIFVLGGDGTLLGAARHFACFEIPMLGINIGHLGFLSETEPDNLEESVQRVLNGDFYLERRMMIETVVMRNGTCVHRNIALNDVGVGKSSFARMIQLGVYVDNQFYDEYFGDGVLVSTPTGSTAYSLSCGGPVVVPNLQVMLVTPICAHKLVVRPIVIGATQQIRIKVAARHRDFGLTVDGQVGFPLESGDEVIVSKAACDTVLIRWQERAFFSILQEKLRGD